MLEPQTYAVLMLGGFFALLFVQTLGALAKLLVDERLRRNPESSTPEAAHV